MLFRRFMLVTACIALMGVLLANIIQTTRPRAGGFIVEQRMQEWKLRDAGRSCENSLEFCSRPDHSAHTV